MGYFEQVQSLQSLVIKKTPYCPQQCSYTNGCGSNYSKIESNQPCISFCRFNKLCGCIIIRYIKPEAMRDGSRDTLSQTEWIPTDKVCTLPIRIIQCVEKEGSCWRKNVCDMLLQGIDLIALWILCNLSWDQFKIKKWLKLYTTHWWS
jgi:hypothetical protein